LPNNARWRLSALLLCTLLQFGVPPGSTTLTVSGPAAASSFALRTPWTIQSASGVDFVVSGPCACHFSVKPSLGPRSQEYEHSQASVKFASGAGS